jgi:hypothetical protein
MSVAALVGHLVVGGILRVEDALATEPPADFKPVTAAQLLSWVPLGSDDGVHGQVREVAAKYAVPGVDHLIERATTSLDRVAPMLQAEGLERVVAYPWAPSLSMTVRELLRSRVLELVVHVEDVAASIGADDFALDPDAVRIACHLGIDVNIERYGAASVVRALCRRERHGTDSLRTF